MNAQAPVAASDAAENRSMLAVPQICRLLNVSKSTVYALIDSGELSSYHIGTGRGAIRVSLDDLNAYLASRRTGDSPQQAAVRAPRQVKLEKLTPRRMEPRAKKKRPVAS